MAKKKKAEAQGEAPGVEAVARQAVELADSNLADYDSPEAKAARKDAAKSEAMFKGAGSKPGLQIWRVENRRTASDVPDFGINHVPQDTYGQFYTGDSYVVLNTYTDNLSKKLLHDVHFWLGTLSSQDELGVAAYKAVELDDFLDGAPVQHREVQGHESQLFKSYFSKIGGIVYLEGGIASGFRPVKPEEYKPRLFHIVSDPNNKKNIAAYEVEPKFKSLNQGDVFILDLGTVIYNFAGDCSDSFERMKGTVLASNLKLGRGGSVKVTTDIDDGFWRALGGGSLDKVPLKMVSNIAPIDSQNQVNINNCALYRLTDESGTMKFLKVHQGRVYPSMLRSKDVFIVDSGPEIFIWEGKEASVAEKAQAMDRALRYMKEQRNTTKLAVTRVIEDQPNKAFEEVVYAGKLRKGWLSRSLGSPDDPALEFIEKALGGLTELFDACSGARDIAPKLEREWNIVDRATLELEEADHNERSLPGERLMVRL